MKTNFLTKLLRFLDQKQKDQEFTIILFVVVLIVLGLTVAVMFPSDLSTFNEADASKDEVVVG